MVRPGRDLLSGGSGSDRLVGGPGDDILISGTTRYDDDETALRAIAGTWTREDLGYIQRVVRLIQGVGTDGAITLSAAEVWDDDIEDKLTGGAGTDWFLASSTGRARDKVTDWHCYEMLAVYQNSYLIEAKRLSFLSSCPKKVRESLPPKMLMPPDIHRESVILYRASGIRK